jgi:hypothetical protein
MAQPQNNVAITAPGFAGLNTQDSPLDMDPSFASVANNCTIDNFGRISNRRGFQYLTSNPVVLDGNPVVSMAEFIKEDDGATSLFVCGNNKIFIQDTLAPFELVEQTLPNVVVGDNWQMAQLNDKMFFVQAGNEPLFYDGQTGLFAVLDTAGVEPTNDFPNCVHAAFGRLWLGDYDANTTAVSWSSILDGTVWNAGGAGTLQTSEYWPSGYDEVVAIAAHNNFMIIYGSNNILLYQTTSDVINTLNLVDTIEGIGCISRDTVVPTGTDFMFCDSTGVRSLNRTIQEKSVPIGDISMNVRNEFQSALRYEKLGDVKAVYHNEDSFYCCFLPSNPKTYVFDTWNPLPTGAARATVWLGLTIRCGVRTRDRDTFFGGYRGVYAYSGAEDVALVGDGPPFVETPSSIPMEYFTHPMDFGSAANLIFPKQVDVTLIGGLQGDLAIKWAYDYNAPAAQDFKSQPITTQAAPSFWNLTLAPQVAEWTSIATPAGQVGYWTGEQQTVNQLKYNIWGSGRKVKVGFSTDILGSKVSIQELNIQVLQGRLL